SETLLEKEFETQLLEGGIPSAQWPDIASHFKRPEKKSNSTAWRVWFYVDQLAVKPEERRALYTRIFVKSDGAPRDHGFLLKKQKDEEPGFVEIMEAERGRVAALLQEEKAVRLIRRSAKLTALADEMQRTYARLKAAHGLLDFDDMIENTAALFENSNAAWILYKLDSGIDHILVDEAQDTSPVQWKILGTIVEDFFAGATARPRHRTFFAVGDEKQSIFSFQGAEPGSFGSQRQYFRQRLQDADLPFEDVPLNRSFRSAPQILEFVDTVFSIPGYRAGLTSDSLDSISHVPHQAHLAGCVEVWPLVAAPEKQEPENWTMPVDSRPAGDPAIELANRIARHIGKLLSPDERQAVEEDGALRPVQPGDIMILVRKRDVFFNAVLRALKQNSIPVAGADRLKLLDHIAIEDLVAAGYLALLPQDDYRLACVMKSPLGGFDDDDLLALAPHRKGFLITQLLQSETERHRAFAQRLENWSKRARDTGAFEFYAQLLGAEGGRRAFLSRFGEEADEALGEFLRLALEFETRVAGFVPRMAWRSWR
ncbi:MAG: double-strand break repair helicase AddA, partial [Alphaproteobacteria bacterium]|nr:double-strand break repair helicase AddA [Alphaproteobacteria bacterium]